MFLFLLFRKLWSVVGYVGCSSLRSDVLRFTSQFWFVIGTAGRLPYGMGGKLCRLFPSGSLRYIPYWNIPPLVRVHIRDLILAFVLGYDINDRQILGLIYVVDSVYWSEVPISQARRSTRTLDASPGHTGNSGDFVWYEPYTGSFVDAHTTRDRSRTSNPYEYDLSTDYVILSDAKIARWCAACPVPVVLAPVLPYVQMRRASGLVVIPDSEHDIAAFLTLL